MSKVKNERKFRAARIWSNRELSKYSKNFSGSICNVSGWQDSDKEGHKYKDYFENAKEYYVTNYGGYRGGGYEDKSKEILLDLEKELPEELKRKFDVVFNHTVLEHIFNIDKAFANLCEMAKDACIVVVPFLQEVHISESYSDYWRFTPFVLEKMFEKNGFRLVVCDYNNEFDTAVYIFCIGIRVEKLNEYPQFKALKLNNKNPAGRWIGNDNKVLYTVIEGLKRILRFS